MRRIELLEDRRLLTVPFGAMERDTHEFMLGDVYVTVVAFESTGELDPDLETWTEDQKETVKDNVQEALDWWENLLELQQSVHSLDFHIDFQYLDNPISTDYEPISRPSNERHLWIADFVREADPDNAEGVDEDNLRSRLWKYNHRRRVEQNTDWAFTMFVVDNEADSDGVFADERRAFVVRPYEIFQANTHPRVIAHETGHIFYALDEYEGGRSYDDSRGYYNTQNLNAVDDHPNPDEIVDSLMGGYPGLSNAYRDNKSSPSSLEMIGWRDSDQDGIFDVLDVPHTLTGYGEYSTERGMYSFRGESSVQTLPNRNPSSLRNDITLNQISRLQVRIDNGPWSDVQEYHQHVTEIDIEIGPLPEGTLTVELRTIDDASGVTSNVFQGLTAHPTASPMAAVNGFVFHDIDNNGTRENYEPGFPSVAVTLENTDATPAADPIHFEPDDYPHGRVVNNSQEGVTLRAVGRDVDSESVSARNRNSASTGTRVFAYRVDGEWNSLWTRTNRRLRIEFDEPTDHVSIDAVHNSDTDFGRLQVYNAQDELIGRYTTKALMSGMSETMTIARPSRDIAYAIAGGHALTSVRLDNLVVGSSSSGTTDANGAYSIPLSESGTFKLEFAAPDGWLADSTLDPIEFQLGQSYTGIDIPLRRNGDLDASGKVDAADIDVLQVAVRAQDDAPKYDFDGSGATDEQDVSVLVNNVLGIPFGDSNLDGIFNSTDLVLIFQTSEYEDGIAQNSGWADGDWNGDGEFDTGDLVFVFQLATYVPT